MLVSALLSYIQQDFPMYQVQSQVEISTFYSVLFSLFLTSCYIVADFELLRLET